MTLRRLFPAFAVCAASLTHVAVARGQAKWVVDTKASLAWWQVSPNLNHLWATTCPGDPGWRPGEGRSGGWFIDPKLKMPETGYSGVEDTVHVPLFPRKTVSPICAEAVRGHITVDDTLHWRGAHGMVAVRSDAFITGEQMRDVMMHHSLQSVQYPEITFNLDSLVGMTQQGDTLVGTAYGTETVGQVVIVVHPALKVFNDPEGLRVLAKWQITATELGMLAPELHEFGLGINTRIWKRFYMGVDLVLHPAHAAAN
ncbi:MAG TPA: hypothetical protein VN848_12225 [Gemmatimonadales bacterium]|nr:hypothetical protein [Gemmatimonadales bacterium]